MQRLMLMLVVSLFLFTTAEAGARASHEQSQMAVCASVSDYNVLLNRAVRYYVRGGADFHAVSIDRPDVKRLGQMRSCWKRIYKLAYLVERRAWKREIRQWHFYDYIDRITPYGEWAVPGYIVQRESGGNPCAKNPSSTAGGFYQFLDSSWYGYGGKGSWSPGHPAACAPAWMQHVVAHTAMMRSGLSPWALTR